MWSPLWKRRQVSQHTCDCVDSVSIDLYVCLRTHFLLLPQTLSLTCTVRGDPKPQVSWLKNGGEVEPDDQVNASTTRTDNRHSKPSFLWFHPPYTTADS